MNLLCPMCNSTNVKLFGRDFKAVIKYLDCEYTRGGFSTIIGLIKTWEVER